MVTVLYRSLSSSVDWPSEERVTIKPRFPRNYSVLIPLQNERQAVRNHDQRGRDLMLHHGFVFSAQNLQAVMMSYYTIRKKATFTTWVYNYYISRRGHLVKKISHENPSLIQHARNILLDSCVLLHEGIL